MIGYLVLGIALLLSPRRGTRLAGLAVLSLATAMRYNALSITFATGRAAVRVEPAAPRWYALRDRARRVGRDHGRRRRRSTLSSSDERTYLWHQIARARRHRRHDPRGRDLPDAELPASSPGTPLLVTTDIQRTTRTTFPVDSIPLPSASRSASARSFRRCGPRPFTVRGPDHRGTARCGHRRVARIVLGHPGAYLAYRWTCSARSIHLGDHRISNAVYSSFTDSLDRAGSARASATTPCRAACSAAALAVRLDRLVVAVPAVDLPGAVARRPAVLPARPPGSALVLSGLAGEAALWCSHRRPTSGTRSGSSSRRCSRSRCAGALASRPNQRVRALSPRNRTQCCSPSPRFSCCFSRSCSGATSLHRDARAITCSRSRAWRSTPRESGRSCRGCSRRPRRATRSRSASTGGAACARRTTC